MKEKRKRIRKIGRIRDIFANWIRSSGFCSLAHVALGGLFSGGVVRNALARGPTHCTQ